MYINQLCIYSLYCLIKFNNMNFCTRLSYASCMVCVCGCNGRYFHCDVLFSNNFSSNNIDLDGSLLYFTGTSKINRGNLSLLLWQPSNILHTRLGKKSRRGCSISWKHRIKNGLFYFNWSKAGRLVILGNCIYIMNNCFIYCSRKTTWNRWFFIYLKLKPPGTGGFPTR